MNIEEFKIEVKKLGVKIDSKTLNQLNIYYEYLTEYNSHTNLTAIKEKKDVYLKHFYDSLTVTKVIDLNKIKNYLDIGTGAGFPGVILKIFYPHIELYLLDSNNKKIQFLNNLKTKLNIEYKTIHKRAEDFVQEKNNYYDLVTARAVSNLSLITELSIPFINLNGYFIALKGNVDNELKELKKNKHININVEDIVEFNLYKNDNKRALLKIRKSELTNISKLRKYNEMIVKK